MIRYARSVLTSHQLADDLAEAPVSDYVRLVADWLHRAARDPDLDVDSAPPLTGVAVVDALVAASAAHIRFSRQEAVPSWTVGAQRRLDTLWYPGPDALLPNALVHSPVSFSIRGLFIEADSLESV